MKRRILYSLTIVAAFFGCYSSDLVEPEVLLSDSVMVNVMTDSYILNNAFHQTTGTVKDSIAHIYSDQIFEKWGVDKDVFTNNLEWLYRNPARLDSIYEKMLDRLDRLEDGISEDVQNSSNK